MQANDDDKNTLIFQPSQASWALVKFVNAPPALFARAFVYVLLLFFPMAIIVLLSFKVQSGTSSVGIAVPRFPFVKVVAPADLTVTGVFVQAGQKVKVGDALYAFATVSDARDIASVPETRFPSPVAGTVFNVEAGDQSRLRGGDVLLTVLPNSTPLEVEIQIPNQMLASVHEGMDAQVGVSDANGESTYVMGSVREIQAVLDDGRREPMPAFRVRVSLGTAARPELHSLRIGQAVKVSFGQQKQSLMTLLLNKIMSRDSSTL